MTGKFAQEFHRLLRQHGRYVALLHLVDANVRIRQELEHEDKVLHHEKRSVTVERSREQLQRDLAATTEQLADLVTLMIVRGEQADE